MEAREKGKKREGRFAEKACLVKLLAKCVIVVKTFDKQSTIQTVVI